LSVAGHLDSLAANNAVIVHVLDDRPALVIAPPAYNSKVAIEQHETRLKVPVHDMLRISHPINRNGAVKIHAIAPKTISASQITVPIAAGSKAKKITRCNMRTPI
jgi:hypothetical protein